MFLCSTPKARFTRRGQPLNPWYNIGKIGSTTPNMTQHKRMLSKKLLSERLPKSLVFRLTSFANRIEERLLDRRLTHAGASHVKQIKTWTTRRELKILME